MENKERKVEVNLGREHFNAAWYAVKRIIQEEVCATKEDTGFLMETMTKMALPYDNPKNEILRLPYDNMRAIWICCNDVVEDKLYRSQGQQMMIIEAMSLIAIKLDDYNTIEVLKDTSPMDLV
jgi:hypothetical protein